MSTKTERCEHANQLIQAISRHGRKFFWCESKYRLARMEVDEHGKVWFIDDYSGQRIYTHYRGAWRGFSHGGTIKFLIENIREYIRTGRQISIWRIAPNRGLMDANLDMWGYGDEACEALQAEVVSIPIIRNS